MANASCVTKEQAKSPAREGSRSGGREREQGEDRARGDGDVKCFGRAGRHNAETHPKQALPLPPRHRPLIPPNVPMPNVPLYVFVIGASELCDPG